MPILQGDYDDFEVSGKELRSREDSTVDTYRTESIGATVVGTNTVNLIVTNAVLGLDLISEGDAPVESGDKIEITGNTADGGTYTIDVVSAQSVTVLEALSGGTGGTAKFIHKMGSKRAGFKHANILGSTTFEAIEDVAKFFKKVTVDGTGGPDVEVIADVIKTILNLISSDGSIVLDADNTDKTIDLTLGGGVPVFTNELSSTDKVSTPSSSYVDMPTTQLAIPKDGQFWIVFMCDLKVSKSKDTTLVINVNGTDIGHSKRKIKPPGGKRQAFATMALSGPVTQGDIVKVRWKIKGGEVAKTENRAIILLRSEI